MAKGFNIAAEAALAKEEDKGTVVEIIGIEDLPMLYDHPDGSEKPVTITVMGAHSSAFRRIEAALRKRKLKPRQLTSGAIFDDNVEKVVACTMAWEGFASDQDGEFLDFSRTLVRVLYDQCPWVYDQVMEAMHDHSNFSGSGSIAPSSTSDSQQD